MIDGQIVNHPNVYFGQGVGMWDDLVWQSACGVCRFHEGCLPGRCSAGRLRRGQGYCTRNDLKMSGLCGSYRLEATWKTVEPPSYFNYLSTSLSSLFCCLDCRISF